MYTRCPHCRTTFEIAEDTLQASLGIVRCGHCGHRFDALESLSATPPADTPSTPSAFDPRERTPTLTAVVAAPQAPASSTATGPPPARPVRHSDRTWFVPLSSEAAEAASANPEEDASAGIADEPDATPRGACDAVPVAEAGADPAPTTARDSGATPEAQAVTEETAAPVDSDATVQEAPSPAPADGIADAEPPESSDLAINADAAAAEHAVTGTADASATEATPNAGPEPGVEPPAPADTAAVTAGDDMPGPPLYVPPHMRRVRRSDWLFGCAAAVLLLLLAAQLTWAERGNLVRNPATQSIALRACALIDCRLPPIRDLGKLQLLSRDVRPDPGHPGDLAITASIRNAAPFRQPWPVLVVRLTGLDNVVIAMRRFQPRDYLPSTAQREAGMAPGATAAIALTVADPGKPAVAFRFGFD